MTTIATRTHNLTRSHTSVFVSDKMRNLLKQLVINTGLNPEKLVDAWTSWVDNAVRTWLESGDLLEIIIEFYRPGSNVAEARWDFPIRYDGNGVDEQWVDRDFFRDSFDKATKPPAGCEYRILLRTRWGRRDIPGMEDTEERSLAGLYGREAGTVIATPDIMASARYYRR